MFSKTQQLEEPRSIDGKAPTNDICIKPGIPEGGQMRMRKARSIKSRHREQKAMDGLLGKLAQSLSPSTFENSAIQKASDWILQRLCHLSPVLPLAC